MMAPDIEELIKRVNTLTLDKTRLKQKLTQQQSSIHSDLNHQSSLSRQSSSSSNNNNFNSSNNNKATTPPTSNNNNNNSSCVIAGVECSTSCEDDILYMNELYRKRLDEYNKNWTFLQSKCTALLAELNALQKNYIILKREKSDVETRLNSKCDDYEKLQNELQTVVLNYETQLSAMSEHLSSITSQQANALEEALPAT